MPQRSPQGCVYGVFIKPTVPELRFVRHGTTRCLRREIAGRARNDGGLSVMEGRARNDGGMLVTVGLVPQIIWRRQNGIACHIGCIGVIQGVVQAAAFFTLLGGANNQVGYYGQIT